MFSGFHAYMSERTHIPWRCWCHFWHHGLTWLRWPEPHRWPHKLRGRCRQRINNFLFAQLVTIKTIWQDGQKHFSSQMWQLRQCVCPVKKVPGKGDVFRRGHLHPRKVENSVQMQTGGAANLGNHICSLYCPSLADIFSLVFNFLCSLGNVLPWSSSPPISPSPTRSSPPPPGSSSNSTYVNNLKLRSDHSHEVEDHLLPSRSVFHQPEYLFHQLPDICRRW